MYFIIIINLAWLIIFSHNHYTLLNIFVPYWTWKNFEGHYIDCCLKNSNERALSLDGFISGDSYCYETNVTTNHRNIGVGHEWTEPIIVSN